MKTIQQYDMMIYKILSIYTLADYSSIIWEGS